MPLLLMAAQAVTAPPPHVTNVPKSPPIIVSMGSYPGPDTSTRYLVDTEVRGGGAVLWSGPLRIGGGYGQTSIRREQSEPGDASCGAGEIAAPIQTSFALSLSPRGRDGSLAVTVRWSRPGEQPCGQGPNSRTVELASTVTLAPGGSATLTGDGGLSVRLRRR